jgi:transcription termination factor NusB
VSVSAARKAAYEVLLRVFEQDAYADRAFRTAAEGLDERDRAFAQRLAYGSVQRVRTLDHAIETLGKRPVRKLDAPVKAALRLGAYQLGYTDTAPHAAVNESVELVRRARLERAVPFTNAVMRRLDAGIRPLLDSLPEGPLKESYPDWIAETFERVLGNEGALALMRTMNEPLETVVRLVRGEPSPSAEPTDIPGAYRVERVVEGLVAAGRIWPQSRGSQLAGLCGQIRPSATLRSSTRSTRYAPGTSVASAPRGGSPRTSRTTVSSGSFIARMSSTAPDSPSERTKTSWIQSGYDSFSGPSGSDSSSGRIPSARCLITAFVNGTARSSRALRTSSTDSFAAA